ncbi:uncharacterized protein TRAVEDRAFT_51846 [Trametes versicolor FP-101664 SS1]|uniref:uncharacterized protein n=1 Tax=Trametes versicolor (strain FP-101664) TaxID=717944 RepID=UPI0004623ED1|nr:uncharacterized protein TRAVEDRAFT_51846 [Trametes versicolor FP-101664 SS1]EIW54121.1 hypothetical protein TRAVEDRAFT_51846 [Trametes versicolor FP-101664 SS1]
MPGALDVLSTVLSIIGFLAILCQLLYWILQKKLPRAKLRIVEAALAETETLLDRCVEEGRLGSGNEAAGFREVIDKLQARTNQLRIRVLSGTTFVEDLRHMLSTWSDGFDDICVDIRRTQADISISSAAYALQSPRENDAGMSAASAGATPVADTSATSETQSTASSSSSSHSSASSDSWVLPDDARLIAPPLPELPLTGWRDDARSPRADWNAPWGERRKSVSSSKTSSTHSLRRKKQGYAVARTRALARAARLSYA